MKRLFKISMLALMVVLTMTGCKKSYTITVKSNNDAWGSVTGSGTYKDGETVEISAVPAQGYYFNCWSDGNSENPRKIIVSGNAEFIATFSDTPGGGTENALEVSGSISANTTWPDRGAGVDYIINGRFFVEGNALLTIEPGVTIMFTGVDGAIHVEENAGIRMLGTADKHITLVGPTNNPNKGSWNTVYVTSARDDNQFAYVDFFNGGSYETPVVEVPGTISMRYCTINGGLGDGVVVGGTLNAFENNTIKNMNRYPLVLEKHKMVNGLGTGNSFTNNGVNMIHMTAVYLDNVNATTMVRFTNQGVPYFFSEGIRTETRKDGIRIRAGVEMVFENERGIYINEDGVFLVEGTESEPVIFRGAENEAGFWNGIEFESTRDMNNANQLVNCVIKNAGVFDGAALRISEDAYLPLTNVTIEDSHGYGMIITIPVDWETGQYDFSNYHVTGTGLHFSNCAQGSIYETNKEQIYTTIPTAKKLARK